jgi:hypothetical protein
VVDASGQQNIIQCGEWGQQCGQQCGHTG